MPRGTTAKITTSGSAIPTQIDTLSRRRRAGILTSLTTSAEFLETSRTCLACTATTKRSSYVREVQRDADSAYVWKAASGLEFWGGSGAVWEVPPFHLTHPQAGNAAREDYVRFRMLMIELEEALERRNMSSLAESTADLFRRQLSDEEG